MKKIDYLVPTASVFILENSDISAIDNNLLSDILHYCESERKLPAKFGSCGLVAENCMVFCQENHNNYKGLVGIWLTMIGSSDFHSYCGGGHQVPMIYYKENFYFLDFFNFFDKDNLNCKLSVIVLPAKSFIFNMITEFTGSNSKTCWVSNFSTTFGKISNNLKYKFSELDTFPEKMREFQSFYEHPNDSASQTNTLTNAEYPQQPKKNRAFFESYQTATKPPLLFATPQALLFHNDEASQIELVPDLNNDNQRSRCNI